jgi:Uma2 family endonuclease
MAIAARSAYPTEAPPPLENGDLLTRDEFERRWELHPEIKKAELINGMAFVQLTVSRKHSKPHSSVAGWAIVYAASNGAVEVLTEATVRLGDHDLQPDVLIRRLVAGTSTVSDDDCVDGPPELVMEISASSASYDLHIKKEIYRRAGVQEYIVWQQYEERIDWWALEGGQYVALAPNAAGVIESRAFPGLRLAVAAMLEGDLATVLKVQQAG